MRFADILKMCFDSLSRRKGRTILTVLGVFIGCTSIIVMVSIGAGMQESYDQMLKNMGDLSIIEVYRGYNQNTGTQTESKLDDKAVESFHEIAGVQAVMPKASLDGYNISASRRASTTATAPTGSTLPALTRAPLRTWAMSWSTGGIPESSDEVVVGQYFAYNFKDTLMPDGRNYVDRYIWDENGNIDTENVPDPFFDPLKTGVKMLLTSWDDGPATNRRPMSVDLKVVGVLKEDQGKGYETSDGVMMDINALKALIQDLTGKTDTKFEYSSINVKAESLDAVPDVEQSIKDLGYSTYSMQSMRDELNKQTRQIELMLGGLGAISLLVAAIGITNTMIMSISERTKEIGIMKALGCYVRDIRAMFLMEAGSIGLLGGILGLIFSFIISVIINLFSFGAFGGGGVTWELIKQALIGGEGVTRVSVIKPELVIFALVFSVLVGLVSGYQPANKAVKISALEAIRNE
ncbi:MAG: ABC transporter permease [Oscillospiraceae bacterium]